MFKRGLPLLVASLLVLLLGAYWALYFTGNNTEYAKGHRYLVTIKPGMTTADIADLLHKKHLVKTPEAFRMEARLRGLAGKLAAGQYEIEGGMSNGQPIVVRAAMKPIPSIPKALRTVDVTTGEAAKAITQRSDNTAVPAAAVVAEAMVRLTIAQYVLEKFGGDSVAETKRNAESYVASWPEHMR